MVGRRDGHARRHITDDVGAATYPDMASVCARADVGGRRGCHGERRDRHRGGCQQRCCQTSSSHYFLWLARPALIVAPQVFRAMALRRSVPLGPLR